MTPAYAESFDIQYTPIWTLEEKKFASYLPMVQISEAVLTKLYYYVTPLLEELYNIMLWSHNHTTTVKPSPKSDMGRDYLVAVTGSM